MMKSLFTFLAFAIAQIGFAQQGSLSILVLDEAYKEPAPFASVILSQNGAFVMGIHTDFDGLARFNNLEQGEYNLEIKLVGYITKTEQVKVIVDSINRYTFKIKEAQCIIDPPILIRERMVLPPFGGPDIFNTHQILKMPVR